MRAGFHRQHSESFPALLDNPSHLGNGESGEKSMAGKIGVQFVYFNIDFTRQNILSGFLIQGGEYFQSSNIQLWELIFLKRFLSLPKTTVKSLE